MKLMNRLERWMYRFQVRPFFQYLVFAMAGVYALTLFVPRFNLYGQLALYTPLVFQGQLWRLLTFLILPPMGSPLSVILTLYFYYFIGTTLESRWGARRFLLFYGIGAVGAILGGLLTQIGTNHYLYMSMFFAFAVMKPETEVLLFFVLPVKVKWLALLNAAYFVYEFVVGSMPIRAAILFSVAVIILFFGGDLLNLARSEVEQFRRRQRYRRLSK